MCETGWTRERRRSRGYSSQIMLQHIAANQTESPYFAAYVTPPPPATSSVSVVLFYLKRESKVLQHHWPQKGLFLGWWPDLVIIWKTVSKESPLFMLPCGVGWRHFNHWRSANLVPVDSRSLFCSWLLFSPVRGSEDIKLDNGRCRWTIWEFSTTVALKKCEEKDEC